MQSESQSQLYQNSFDQEYSPLLSYEYLDFCQSLAINHNKTLLAISGKNNVRILLLQLMKLKQLQIFPKMQRNISQLNFLQRRSLLICCSEDGSIIIWSLNLISNPKYLFKLRKHIQAISCMVVHPLKEDLIISGSFDKTINFWLDRSSPSSPSQWQCIQTINQHQDFVYGLSINKEGDTLLSCGKDNQILIMQGSRQMEWQIKQKIKLDGEGYRIGFINNGLFAFQSRIPKNRLFLYQLDENTQLFNKLQDIFVEGVGGNQTCAIFFPLVYIDNKHILISKNGQKVNLIKLTFSPSNQIFNQIQSIDYGFQPNGWLFGTVTQDGEYLITWDQKSKNIQIRSKQEQNQKNIYF